MTKLGIKQNLKAPFFVFNRPVVAGAGLQTPGILAYSMIH